MNYQEYCDKLKNKLALDQNQLKDKKEELTKLNNELNLVELKCKEREQLNSEINEKMKTIESLFKSVKCNFDVLPNQIDDLNSYLKQVLLNKPKFTKPINDFQRSLDNTLIELNNQINYKVDYIKSKYNEINQKLQIKKENSEHLTNELLMKYENLKNNVTIEKENIVKLKDDIQNKRNLIEEYETKIIETNEQNKQLELKTESILKENQDINKQINNLKVQFKKVEEDKKSIESKLSMNNELIECTKLMIQELETNINSNTNAQKYKEEYEQIDKQIKCFQKEYEDRVQIYEMKKQCKELKEKKIEQINLIVQKLKSIDTDQNLIDKNYHYESVIDEIQNEIKLLENELERKGLLSQLDDTNQQSQSTQITETQNSTSTMSAKLQLKASLDESQKIKTSESSNKFELVPEELLDYMYDNEAILFETQNDNLEIDEEMDVSNNQAKEKTKNLDGIFSNSFDKKVTDNEDCLIVNTYGLDEFTNSSIGTCFSNVEDPDNFTLTNQSLTQSSQLNTNSQISRSSFNLNDELTFKSPNLSNSQIRTPRSIRNRVIHEQTKSDRTRKHSQQSNSEAKRKRQN